MQHKSTGINVTVRIFCTLVNALVNHSSNKKREGVNESLMYFIITWRGGERHLFRFLIGSKFGLILILIMLIYHPWKYLEKSVKSSSRNSMTKREEKKQKRKKEQSKKGFFLFSLRINFVCDHTKSSTCCMKYLQIDQIETPLWNLFPWRYMQKLYIFSSYTCACHWKKIGFSFIKI